MNNEKARLINKQKDYEEAIKLKNKKEGSFFKFLRSKEQKDYKKEQAKIAERLIKAGPIDQAEIKTIEFQIEKSQEQLKATSHLSAKYHSVDACEKMIEYFDDERVDTLKEALNIYENEKRHNDSINEMRKHEAAQKKRHNEELARLKKLQKSIKDD